MAKMPRHEDDLRIVPPRRKEAAAVGAITKSSQYDILAKKYRVESTILN
jgi:hypothetical protein